MRRGQCPLLPQPPSHMRNGQSLSWGKRKRTRDVTAGKGRRNTPKAGSWSHSSHWTWDYLLHPWDLGLVLPQTCWVRTKAQGPAICFIKPSWWFLCILKFEHCSRQIILILKTYPFMNPLGRQAVWMYNQGPLKWAKTQAEEQLARL